MTIFGLMSQRDIFPVWLLERVIRSQIRTLLNLNPISDQTLPEPQHKEKYTLYIHIPFCERLCPYCTFNRFQFNENTARLYFSALRKEIEMVHIMGYTFEAAYFGGGTPTILIDELVATIDLIEKLFGIQEISCETNPNHLNDTVLTAIKGKVKRLSVGVQSFNDKLLAQMGRLETFGTGEEILKRIQSSAGQVPTLNIDLIYNFPEYSDEILLEDIHQIIRSNADQVTFYPLMTSNSNIHKTYHRYESKSMLEKHYYDLINENISEIYQPVSAWTYARQQDVMVDEYVTKYFQYVGVGSGSFSYLGGSLYVNTFSIKDYISRIQNGLSPLSAYREFSKLAQMQYRLMMELFNLKLDVKQFSRDFSKSPHLGVWREYMFLIFSNAIQQKGDYIHVNMSKRYLMVVMMREFFNGVNRIREQSRKDLKLIQ